MLLSIYKMKHMPPEVERGMEDNNSLRKNDWPDPFVLTCLILACVKTVSRRKGEKILKTLQLFRNHRKKKTKLPDLHVSASATTPLKCRAGTKRVLPRQI